ncbi:MAG: class I SAM-dependent methyltransferase, partial [Chloroflexota bacterium]
DTLSWARLGARVTGVDFSGAAISAARDLAAEVELHASFIQCDVYEISRQLDEQFDIVYSSYGVLCWLPDLDEWARAAARHVKPGGIFYLADVHPLAHLLDDEGKKPEPGVRYFHDRVPFRSERHGSYVGGTVPFEQPLTYQWQHSLGEIVSAVSDAGLQVEYLHEFPMVPYEAFPGMIQEEGDWFHLPGDTWPLLFSLRAHRA